MKADEGGYKREREEYIETWRAALKSEGEHISERTVSEDIIVQGQSVFNLDYTALTESQILPGDNEMGDVLD